jgi:hypothetical protein
MAVTFNTTYPAALTNTAWQKKKSFLDKAKSKTKTGLGAELLKAVAAWKNIDFKLLKAEGKVFPMPSQWDTARQTAVSHYDDKVKKASAAALVAASKAATTKGNKALSKTAQTAAGQIEVGLRTVSLRLLGIKFGDFDLAKTNLEELTAQTHIISLKAALRRGHEFVRAVGEPADAVVFSSGANKASRDLMQPLGNIGVVHGKANPKPLGAPLMPWATSSSVSVKSTEVEKALVKYKKALKSIEDWGGDLLS